MAAPPPTGVAGPATPSPPWWATQLFHLVIGQGLLVGGIVLEVTRPGDTFGGILIGSSLTFLGVGAGIGVAPTGGVSGAAPPG